MSEEEKTKKPKFVIPDSGKEKASNRLLVPQESSSSVGKESKLKLVAEVNKESSDSEGDLQNVISSNENPVITQQPESSVIESDLEEPVKVVAMTPPPMEEGVVGGLPNQNEDDWMKEAYQQVENADRINEEIKSSQDNQLEVNTVNEVSQDHTVEQEGTETVQQMPPQVASEQSQVEVPTIHQIPQAPPVASATQYNQPYTQQAYPAVPQQGYYQQTPYGNYQNQMMPPQEQLMQVPSKSGLPGWFYFLLGACIAAIIMVLLFARGPQKIAESLRPDLVEKGKILALESLPDSVKKSIVIDGVPQGEVKK